VQSFREQVAVKSVHVDRVPCRVRSFLETLPVGELAEVAEAIDDLTLTAPALAQAILSRYDFPIAHQVIARHRRRLYGNGCKCE
jgi:hypothetical protein